MQNLKLLTTKFDDKSEGNTDGLNKSWILRKSEIITWQSNSCAYWILHLHITSEHSKMAQGTEALLMGRANTLLYNQQSFVMRKKDAENAPLQNCEGRKKERER